MDHGQGIKLLDQKGVEWLCDEIVEGKSLRTIAKALRMNVSTVTRWVAADEYRTRVVREARTASAQAFDDLALECILSAKNRHQLGVAKEAAHHYRWRARCTDPKIYGDKVEIEQHTTISDMSEAQIDARLAALQAKAKADAHVDVGANPG